MKKNNKLKLNKKTVVELSKKKMEIIKGGEEGLDKKPSHVLCWSVFGSCETDSCKGVTYCDNFTTTNPLTSS